VHKIGMLRCALRWGKPGAAVWLHKPGTGEFARNARPVTAVFAPCN